MNERELKGKIKTTAITIGLFWAVCLFIITLISYKIGYGKEFLKSIVSIYPGFSITIKGAFIGLIWGFLDGFIGTYLFVWVWKFIDKMVNIA